MLGLNPLEGGVLEFLLVFLGDGSDFGSYVANAALSFWIFCHSSTIKASFASFDSWFRSGSFSIPLSNVYLAFLSRGLSNYNKTTAYQLDPESNFVYTRNLFIIFNSSRKSAFKLGISKIGVAESRDDKLRDLRKKNNIPARAGR
jgi:hypothetical protein